MPAMAVHAVAALALLSIVAPVLAADGVFWQGNPPLTGAIFTPVPVQLPPNYYKSFHFTRVYTQGKNHDLQYLPLLKSGTTYPGWNGGTFFFASIPTANGSYLTGSATEQSQAAGNTSPAAQSDFDRVSIFDVNGKIYAIAQQEVQFGAMYIAELLQDNVTGVLSVKRVKPYPTYGRMGLARPCSGSFTPWGTHFFAEETAPNARGFPTLALSVAVNGRTGTYSTSGFKGQAAVNNFGATWQNVSPYWNGWVGEAGIAADGETLVYLKHWTFGRASHELCKVMPDNATVYCTDDESNNGILKMFVADTPGNLSCGKLYAAKWNQISDADGGEATITWINLHPGNLSMCNSEFEPYISDTVGATVKFSDLWDFEAPTWAADGSLNAPSDPSFRVVVHESGFIEYLRPKAGMEGLAGRFESRRMAGYLGATTEFSKWEGIALDTRRKNIFFACTSIRGGMLDGPFNRSLGTVYDVASQNHIRLPSQFAGAVYRGLFKKGTYELYNLKAFINSFGYTNVGGIENVPSTSIASPDNLSYSAKLDVLFINEDCDDQHINNMMWAYDMRRKTMTRIAGHSKEAEVTNGYWMPNVGAFNYLTTNIQHPNLAYEQGTIGYWVWPGKADVPAAGF